MTKVIYYPDEFRMEIKGHAGAGDVGQDLVCAGVSTLSWALMGAATDDPDFDTHLYMCDKDAEIRVDCHPDEEHEALCREMFRTILTGFEALAEEFPDHVTVIGGSNGD